MIICNRKLRSTSVDSQSLQRRNLPCLVACVLLMSSHSEVLEYNSTLRNVLVDETRHLVVVSLVYPHAILAPYSSSTHTGVLLPGTRMHRHTYSRVLCVARCANQNASLVGLRGRLPDGRRCCTVGGNRSQEVLRVEVCIMCTYRYKYPVFRQPCSSSIEYTEK